MVPYAARGDKNENIFIQCIPCQNPLENWKSEIVCGWDVGINKKWWRPCLQEESLFLTDEDAGGVDSQEHPFFPRILVRHQRTHLHWENKDNMSLQTALKTVDYKCVQYIRITHYATVYQAHFLWLYWEDFFFNVFSLNIHSQPPHWPLSTWKSNCSFSQISYEPPGNHYRETTSELQVQSLKGIKS